MEAKLLTRDDFREGVFARDGHKCVFCGKHASEEPVFAHHILERRLFDNGGYYLENGATVCNEHHLECEMTILSVEEVREACGIKLAVVPDHMYPEQIYDKWGNPVLDDGKRTKGPLFYDESVQKILEKGGVLDLFVPYTKAVRTMHLPWSPGIHDDDKVIKNLDAFHGEEVIMSKKMDGENTSMYTSYFHARSIDGRSHPSRSMAKAQWGRICGDIPENWRITGENVYATHSIHYDDLDAYFYGFGVWNEKNWRLDWDEMLEWFNLLDITPVPVLYRGPFNIDEIVKAEKTLDLTKDEGYVITTVKGFPYSEYHKKVAKYVRKGHVQTHKHWMHGQRIVPNRLKDHET